ncbi:MAG TPA: Mur ligase family protein [Candidatus Saccharimonadia bacterium]
MAAKKLYFLGITGHTMRGLALAVQQLGYTVIGSDPGSYSVPGEDALDTAGIQWSKLADPAELKGIDGLIISGGTPADDPMLAAAKQRKIKVRSYAEFVGELAKSKRRIVVAGTHGKTTTTSLIAWLLESAGCQPDFLVGVRPHNFGSSVRLGDGRMMVLEGDEYRASTLDDHSKFWFYRPDVLVATSLEMDHPDMFTNVAAIRERFTALVKAMPKDGLMIYWAGSEELKKVAKTSAAAVQSYGIDGDLHVDHVAFGAGGVSFDLYKEDVYQGHFSAPLYGQHNVDNATAAIAVAAAEGLSVEEIQAGLQSFRGAVRRFDIVSPPQAAIRVVDDYAHHPSEIAATIEAARLHFDGRVLAVVRPHTYSRVKELMEGYREAVQDADMAFVASIEGAREAELETVVSGADIARENGNHVVYEPNRRKLIERVVEAARPGDVVVSMTVGGYDGLAAELATRLNQR